MPINKNKLLQKFDSIIKKWEQKLPQRFLYYPIFAIKRLFFSTFIRYLKFEKPFILRTRPFFGGNMIITIPPYADLFISGVYYGDPEFRLTKFIIRHLSGCSVFFDIGANIGYYSLLCSTIYPQMNIFSFEPNPEILQLLMKNVYNKTTIVDKAVSDNEGHSNFYCSILSDNGISTLNLENINKSYYKKFKKKILVETMTLDKFSQTSNIHPDFIKIDVEGSEEKVLRGTKFLLQNYSPIIAMEVWFKPFSNSYRQALLFLKEMDYNIFSINGSGDLEPLTYESLPNYFSFLERRYQKINDPDIYDNLIFMKVNKHSQKRSGSVINSKAIARLK